MRTILLLLLAGTAHSAQLTNPYFSGSSFIPATSTPAYAAYAGSAPDTALRASTPAYATFAGQAPDVGFRASTPAYSSFSGVAGSITGNLPVAQINLSTITQAINNAQTAATNTALYAVSTAAAATEALRVSTPAYASIAGQVPASNLTSGILPTLDGSNLYNVKGSPVSPMVYYYGLNMNSDVSGYGVLSPIPSVLLESSKTITAATSNTDYLIRAFASPIGSPGTTTQPTGTSTRHIYLASSGNSSIVRSEIWIRHQDGSEYIMFTGTASITTPGTITEYLIPITISASSTILTTDRYISKIYGRKTAGGSATITMYAEGTARASRIDTTFKGAIQAAKTLSFDVENGEAFTIYKGRPVYIMGSDVGLPKVGRADNTTTTKSRVVGMMSTDCISGAACVAIRYGLLEGLDTSVSGSSVNALGETWAAGDLLFLTANGNLTNTRPTSGRSVKVGYDLFGNSAGGDAIMSYPMENPVWTTAASGENVVLRAGDSIGATGVSIRNYVNVGVATITSQGNIVASTATFAVLHATATGNSNYSVISDSGVWVGKDLKAAGKICDSVGCIGASGWDGGSVSNSSTFTATVNASTAIVDALYTRNDYSGDLLGEWKTWTPTFTGFSASPSGYEARYIKIGKTVCVQYIPSTYGTSNSGTFYITLPFAAHRDFRVMLWTMDNSAAAISTAIGFASSGSTTLQLYGNYNSVNWTASGTKDILSMNFCYEAR
jgi:hypothetical protein